jgi:hypothetical protein
MLVPMKSFHLKMTAEGELFWRTKPGGMWLSSGEFFNTYQFDTERGWYVQRNGRMLKVIDISHNCESKTVVVTCADNFTVTKKFDEPIELFHY